ncbi:styrene monooxygenase/indole monooxygenase family protein [Dasania marina]|uniref:styrene monooxygenase/indole monooxygenase family protein n=1 Tax=Dasania marina TaxID=471499 RepID=UPI000366CCA2|nr:styrene monooxygenase/indole monooxygenase family protein [Dasania marina]
MRNITIIGAGQSGLQLGIGLLKQGYQVRIVTNKTANEVASGRILSSQCMFGTSCSYEKALGLNYWDDECPAIEGIGFAMNGPDGNQVINWKGKLEQSAQSVDQRVKMPRWMQEFESLGGKLDICDAGIEELEQYATEADLVLVASGKGEVGQLFKRDSERSAFDKPMRALGLTYVNNMPLEEEYSTVAFNVIPGVGEYFVFPALTFTGPCHIMVFEGIPGGEMDCWKGVDSPEQHLALSKQLVEKFVPAQAHRCKDIEMTDDNGRLAGRFPPTIKHVIGTLPSGAKIMGIGDAVCLNDPITGQGSNNASKAAKVYLDAILAREDQPFDELWMGETFEAFWSIAKYVVEWTNGMLLPPAPHVQALLGFANTHNETAKKIANAFDTPHDYFPWFMQADAAKKYMESVSAEA